MQITKYLIALLFFLYLPFQAFTQAPKKPNSAEIYESIKKLNFLGSVLYIAAHPDDENTRLISYFSNNVHARTAYLSITRGDGGQNLIGPEIRELLGVIRTNELLRARETDGGEQFFTRANDFGYSKHPDETLKIWNKQEVLNDVVRIIREFQPDIIINRFNASSAGKTHGHHTSSAILSTEAFDLANDPGYETGSLEPWKTRRLFFNTHWWFYGSREKFDEVDKSEMLSFDIGVYFPSLGLSNSEISSLSRSMHKSQGFGSTGTRGSEKEYVELLKGSMPSDKENFFEGVDTTWNRLEGGGPIGAILEKVEREFDFKAPYKSVPDLLKAYGLISELKNEHWRKLKMKQIKEVIWACSGLFLEGVAEQQYVTRNQTYKVNLEAINRSQQEINLEKIVLEPGNRTLTIDKKLTDNTSFTKEVEITVPGDAGFTAPYWLAEKGTLGMYAVPSTSLIGQPLTIPEQKVVFTLDVGGTVIDFEKNIVFKFNDPVKGEVYEPLEVVPYGVVDIASKVIIFNEEDPKEIPVRVRSFKDSVSGTVSVNVPDGWKVSPAQYAFKGGSRDEELNFVFTVTPTSGQSEGFLRPSLNILGDRIEKSMVEINYDHIPKQSVLLPAESKVVRLNLVKRGESVGYIKGAGDEIPKYLQQIGYVVTEIEPRQITAEGLSQFDAVILGIRAYNTVPELKVKQPEIFEYVKNGGNVIVQYNTNHRLVVEENLAPYPLELSRDRITDENAKVSFLAKDHEILNSPNKIEKADFDGWVQERGLYFPDKWSDKFTPILSFQENGEPPMKGSLLVSKYGQGYYIYTGLSLFRELPAGVPGAYKLFANMISIGKSDPEEHIKK